MFRKATLKRCRRTSRQVQHPCKASEGLLEGSLAPSNCLKAKWCLRRARPLRRGGDAKSFQCTLVLQVQGLPSFRLCFKGYEADQPQSSQCRRNGQGLCQSVSDSVRNQRSRRRDKGESLRTRLVRLVLCTCEGASTKTPPGLGGGALIRRGGAAGARTS